MKKFTVIKLLILLATVFLMMQFVSCSGHRKGILLESKNNRIVLLKNDNYLCNLILSESSLIELKKEYPDVFSSFQENFNILSDKSVGSNIIYINADTSKNLDELSAYDKNMYEETKKALDKNNTSKLKSKDYYVHIDKGGIMIACGSSKGVFYVLDYLSREYISNGISENGEFSISVPRSGFYRGEYLEGAEIANNPIDKYTLLYSSSDVVNNSKKISSYLYEYFFWDYGVSLDLTAANYSKEINNKIIIGYSSDDIGMEYYQNKDIDICSYRILQSGDDLYIMGGSEWAIQYAVDLLIDNYFSQGKGVPKNYLLDGSIYNEQIYKRYGDSDLRLMTTNIWGYVLSSNLWKMQGRNSALYSRLDDFATVFTICKPDILALQEMRGDFYTNALISKMNDLGHSYVNVSGTSPYSFTPLIYNTNTLTLIDSGYHVFTYGSDSASKSYTWACFEQKSSGQRFVAISTHLWWMNVKVVPQSAQYRINQLTEIGKKVDWLIDMYDCPCFVMGDFNCTYNSKEYKVVSKLEFSDCYNIATNFSDNTSGRYNCNSYTFSEKPRVGTYKKNAIDHIIVKNLKSSRVYAYDYVTPNFYGRLSDHAPLYVDVKLNQTVKETSSSNDSK